MASQAERKSSPGPKSVDPANDISRCFLRLVNLPSYPLTGLAGMKPSFGGRLAKPCLLSMHWIVANHRKEDTVSVPAADKNGRPTSATNVDFRARRSRQSCLEIIALHRKKGCGKLPKAKCWGDLNAAQD